MYYIGVDIGGTGIKAGVVETSGKIISKTSAPTNAQGNYKDLVKDIAKLCEAVVKEANLTMDDIESIGMGCPGSVDDRAGVVIYANNIDLTNAPLCDELKKYIDKPAYINNDANCAALGEFFALNDESLENFVAVTLGTGVGGGIIINKKVYSGFNGAGGELGHTVIVVDGNDCTCGRKGCWEAYASATALIKATKEKIEKCPDSILAEIANEEGCVTGKTSWDAAERGDKAGKEVIDEYIKYLSEGIINLINIFQPSVVAIGGGLSRQGDNLLNPVKAYIDGKTYGAGLVKPVEVTMAKLGNDAGIIGAAFLGR